MGRIRRGGYIFEWWVGDHPPRHIHVSDDNGKILGRVRLDPIEPVDEWQPSARVIEIIKELQREGQIMKTLNPLKVPFGTAKGVALRGVRYLQWEDAFEVEFEDGL